MGRKPLVSAVIPTYNSAALVCEAVESVLAQTYPNVETIVVDDGSEDSTVARLGQYGSRITVIQQEHSNAAVARNGGVRAAHGEFVAFLDSDDLWMTGKVEKCVAAFEAHPEAGVIYTALRIHEMDTGARYLLPQYTMSGSMAKDLFLECKGVNTSTLVVRRTCLDEAGPFDEELFRAQDWDLMIRLAEKCQYLHVPEVLTERRLHPHSLSVVHGDLYAKYNLMVIERALARRYDLYGPCADDCFARAHLRFGMAHYRNFRMRAARKEFAQSLGCHWNWTAANYFFRALLPAFVVRPLRRMKMRNETPPSSENAPTAEGRPTKPPCEGPL